MISSYIKRVAIVAGLSECLIYAEAIKYCAFEIGGNPKYYKCPKNEHCCNFGCCVSPGFQIYHLWYYWLLVIIMFLVCSGGGWWYRYWLQGRYRAAASVIPTTTRSSHTRAHSNPQRGTLCQGQQASISYNSSRNTVFLHRMWKGPHRGTPASPPYTATPPTHSTPYHPPNVVLNDLNCPYYQLYGPPPSYDTVIAQSRIKNNPLSLADNSRTAQSCTHHPYTGQQLHTCDYYQSHDNCQHQCSHQDTRVDDASTELHPPAILNSPSNERSSVINPSDNVILDALNNHSIPYNLRGIAQTNDQRPSTSTDSRGIFHFDISKHKGGIGRSKSLD
ncbi:uncharacterized protein [Fopius arisanus]|uniref:WW domain binding protein VOPP1 n=1 Tax=Fopius arisanus TaxID=64838 RepID=A0A9R1T2P7_9HYME|nr:PREDICTED: uncharacterized protein LOC105265693 [Fopius arisanus]